jgi:S-adenosylmethionine:tRNA ribosyltransferase-isomerase
MKLSKFKYKLPEELIALHPSPNRDESRLMIVHKDTGKIEHKVFKDIIKYFNDKDVLVFNNTKVFPARLYGNKEKTGAEIEVFLLRSYEEFKDTLYALGETPLPKFINRKVEPEDRDRYQTIFAKHEGAVAAPTAGMHFSRELLKRFEIKGVNFSYITLHVGLGSFRAVEVEDLTKHKMDSEQIMISDEAVDVINEARDQRKRICAVGTTVMRTLESSVSTRGHVNTFEGWTNKFIFPPYEFSVADSMVSNFHLPYSTLLMMVAAFGGYDLIMKAYKTAVKEKYRFGTYGDAMLII